MCCFRLVDPLAIFIPFGLKHHGSRLCPGPNLLEPQLPMEDEDVATAAPAAHAHSRSTHPPHPAPAPSPPQPNASAAVVPATNRPRRVEQHPRIATACQVCRDKKVKCSGSDPCNYCVRRGLFCVYATNLKRRLFSVSCVLLALSPSFLLSFSSITIRTSLSWPCSDTSSWPL